MLQGMSTCKKNIEQIGCCEVLIFRVKKYFIMTIGLKFSLSSRLLCNIFTVRDKILELKTTFFLMYFKSIN